MTESACSYICTTIFTIPWLLRINWSKEIFLTFDFIDLSCMQEAWLTNEMSKAQNLVQESSRLLMAGSRSCLSLPWKCFSSLCCALWPYSVTFLHFLPIQDGQFDNHLWSRGWAILKILRTKSQSNQLARIMITAILWFTYCRRKKVKKTCTNIMLGAMHILPGSVSQMCQLSTPCVVAANSRHTITNVETEIIFGPQISFG